MLQVKTPDEVFDIIETCFAPIAEKTENVNLSAALGRILAEDITATEYVPDFNRSTVDGYAVRARDTFGCSDSIPAILSLEHEVLMGQGADFTLEPDTCCAVPTGGAVPDGADSVVMIEYTDDYGDGTIGINKSVAPGQNMIFRGDDVSPGKTVLSAGRHISSQDIGALAAIGRVSVPVIKKLKVGIISTGDELVPPEVVPGPGQVRDVNSPMLCAMLSGFGAEAVNYGIVIDDEKLLREKTQLALSECDAVILSGGSSVGVKDAACRIIESFGELLLHGIAVKPGKPTILGKAGSKPIIGLPGHPVAAFCITKIFVLPLFSRLMGFKRQSYTVSAVLTEEIGANHGREQFNFCHLERKEGLLYARPIRSKSGLITTLANADGFFKIGRDCEGLKKGSEIQVTICIGE